MGRRRLVLSDDDDEDDEHHQQVPNSTETLTSSNPNPPHIPTPVEISDDDFLDVPEDLHSPPPPPPPPPPISDSPVHDFLANLGLKVRREWLDSCINTLTNSVPRLSTFNVAGKAELCFAEFLFSDMNFSGAGVLPPNLHTLHLVDLPGPFVLQVDEIVNISCPLRGGRYDKAPAGVKRCLKLSMTDGVQRVFGMEYRPIEALEVLAPAGFKVAIQNVHIRRGILVLVPEVLAVLGGVVEDLEAARQRLVNEINKPPRGRRTRTGSGPSLASRATLAAWPRDNVNDHGHANISTSQPSGSFGMSGQGTTFGTAGVGNRGRISEDFNIPNARPDEEPNPSFNAVRDIRGSNMIGASMPINEVGRGRVPEASLDPCVRPIPETNSPWNAAMDVEYTDRRRQGDAAFRAAGDDMRGMHLENLSLPHSRSNLEPTSSNDVDIDERDMVDAGTMHRVGRERVAEALADPSVRQSAARNLYWSAASDDRVTETRGEVDAAFITTGDDRRRRIPEDLSVHNAGSNVEPSPSSSTTVMDNMIDASMPIHQDDGGRVPDSFANPSGRPSTEPNPSSDAASDVRDTGIADEVEHPLILNCDKDTPFTYLASLFANWTTKEDEDIPFIREKIKCFLTGVKEFHFKHRATFELHVYVDDGSLISEILIDHEVVQKKIGHSPKEVTTALLSPDSSVVNGMKEAMKQFQIFLVNFEGIMLVEFNKTSPLPVALEMNQGCSSSDTWLLLRRLNMFTSPRTPQRQHSERNAPIIYISP